MESLLGRQINYHFQTPVYEGPLDLLLNLIEHAELDITTVSLASVTDQYLSYLKGLEHVNADEISAFLVMAAKLLQIKSEALLPRPPARERGEVLVDECFARARPVATVTTRDLFGEIALWEPADDAPVSSGLVTPTSRRDAG